MRMYRVSKSLISLLILSLMLGMPLRLAATVLSHSTDMASMSQQLEHDMHVDSVSAGCHDEAADKSCPCSDTCNGACQHCFNLSLSLLPSLKSQGTSQGSQPQPGLSAPQIVPHPERLIRPPIALHS